MVEWGRLTGRELGPFSAALDDMKKALSSMHAPPTKPKRLHFCLDYSGSMAGGRMQRANQNMLMIYDKYCGDQDEVGFVRFNHEVDTRHGKTFALGIKNAAQRDVLVDCNNAEGGTMFYRALEHCVNQMIAGGKAKGQNNWIVALTDGDSRDTHSAVKRQLAKLKQEGTVVDLVIVGVDVSSSVKDICRDLCTATDDSKYIDASGGLEAMDAAFAQVAEAISGGDQVVMEEF